MFLQIQGIQKSFGAGDSRVDVLKGLDLDIERGEFCVLLGPSGSGKSTLLNIIGGIDSADEGNLVIDGERLADMSEKNLSLYRRKHLGYIFLRVFMDNSFPGGSLLLCRLPDSSYFRKNITR